MRPTAVVVGGMDYNVPKGLREMFEILKHYKVDEMPGSIPACQFVLVMKDFVTHKAVWRIQSMTTARILNLPRGWASMSKALERIGLVR